MRRPPIRRIHARKPAKPELPDLPTTYLPGGGIATDFGPGLFEMMLREHLAAVGIKKAPPGKGGAG